MSRELSRGSAALGLSEEEGEGAAPAVTRGRREVRASVRVQPSRRTDREVGRSEKQRRGDQTHRETRSLQCLDSRLGHRLGAPGSEDVLVTHRGARSRPVAGDTGWWGPPRWRLLPGARQGRRSSGQHAAGSPEGEGQRGEAQAPCARRPPAGRAGLCGSAPRRMLSTSRFLKSLPGPRVCLHPPPAPPRPTRG